MSRGGRFLARVVLAVAVAAAGGAAVAAEAGCEPAAAAMREEGGHLDASRPDVGLRVGLLPLSDDRPPPPPRIRILAPSAACPSKTCSGTRQGPVGLGDIVALRQPAAMPDLATADRQRFALAFASQDAATAERLLGPLLERREPDIHYVARLAILQVAVKQGGALRGREAELAALREASRRPGITVPTSDLHFLAGLSDLEAGRPLAAMAEAEAALALEPLFFNAHLLRLHAVLAQSGKAGGACAVNAARLLRALVAFRDLAPCPHQMAFVDLMFDPATTPYSRSAELGLARAYFARIAESAPAVAAHARDVRSMLARSALPAACEAMLLDELAGLETAPPVRQDPR